MRKNIGSLLLMVVIFIAFIPSVKALDDGEITSISCKSMTGGIVNNNHNVTVNGLDIKVDDVTFEDVDDYLTCEMIIKNNSEDVLSVDLESISKKSDDYITYSLATEEDNEILQNESKKYTLNIKYQNIYDGNRIIDNNIAIKMSGDTSSISNPATNVSSYIMLVVVLLIGSILIIVYGKRKGIALSIILVILTIIPVVYALTRVTINLENRIIIEKMYGVYYTYETYIPVDTYEEEKAKYYKVESEYDSCKSYYEENNNSEYSDSEIEEECMQELENYKENRDGIDYYPVTVTVLENRYKLGDTVTMVDFDNVCEDCYYGYFWEYHIISSDLDDMNFVNNDLIHIYNYYNENLLSTLLPQSFTMPDHDVQFIARAQVG